MKGMINISSNYINLGNEYEWRYFLEWYADNIGEHKEYPTSTGERININNVFRETIAYQIKHYDKDHMYCVDSKLHSLMRKKDSMNIDVNRLLRIEAAVKVMLDANPNSGSKSHDPDYTIWVACDKYAAVSDAFYGKE